MDLEKLWWTKKIKAQNRLKNIKNNTTLETLIKKIFKEFNITLAPINKFNIKNLMNVNYKDKEPPLKKSGIYKINCN